IPKFLIDPILTNQSAELSNRCFRQSTVQAQRSHGSCYSPGQWMKQSVVEKIILREFHGRRTAWIVASIVSSILAARSFFAFRDTCDLMFRPTVVARNYAIAWICLFVFIGVTNSKRSLYSQWSHFSGWA